jgi:hypothetical protein
VRTCGYCKLICYDILHITHITAVYSRTCLLYRKYLLFTSCGIIWHHLPEAMLITVSWKGFMYMSITTYVQCHEAALFSCSQASPRHNFQQEETKFLQLQADHWRSFKLKRFVKLEGHRRSFHPSIHLLIYLSTYMRSQTVALSQMDVWKKLPKLEVAEAQKMLQMATQPCFV